MPIKSRIRTIPNYPKPGVMFRDIMTLLQDPEGFRLTIEQMLEPFVDVAIDKVAGIEARGFILAGAIAHRLDAGFVAVRKKGKLPFGTYELTYALEYGYGAVEIHTDAIAKGERVVIVDDLLATGGTMAAAAGLVKQAAGQVAGIAVIIELTELEGRKALNGYDVFSLLKY